MSEIVQRYHELVFNGCLRVVGIIPEDVVVDDMVEKKEKAMAIHANLRMWMRISSDFIRGVHKADTYLLPKPILVHGEIVL